MKKKRREIWIGKSKIYLGADNILYITSVGEIDEKMALIFVEKCLKFMKMIEGKVDRIIDLNKCGKVSSGARKIFVKFNVHEKTGKVAHIGMNSVTRVIASFVMGSSKKKDMRFFKTKEEALAWLKE